jgi:hypothetical protein
MIIIPSLKTLATVCKNNRHCLGKQPPLFLETTAIVLFTVNKTPRKAP